jgi:hypothetical protein
MKESVFLFPQQKKKKKKKKERVKVGDFYWFSMWLQVSPKNQTRLGERT